MTPSIIIGVKNIFLFIILNEFGTNKIVGDIGFEPMTSALSRRHSKPTELISQEGKYIKCIKIDLQLIKNYSTLV